MVLGANGSTLRVPDSAGNRKEFRLPPASRSTAGYPQVRVSVLMALRSHLRLDFNFADCRTGEGTIAWAGQKNWWKLSFRRQSEKSIPIFRPRILLTSLTDTAAYPTVEIAELYHERWELELGYDELKTHTLEREESIVYYR